MRLLLQNRTFERWAQARSAFGVINNGLIKTLRQVRAILSCAHHAGCMRACSQSVQAGSMSALRAVAAKWQWEGQFVLCTSSMYGAASAHLNMMYHTYRMQSLQAM
jgi:hypothetical protein